MLRKTQTVNENQRLLVFKNQELIKILNAGKHTLWDIKNELNFTTFDINELFVSLPNVERLYRNSEVLKTQIEHWKLDNDQVGILYVNDQLKGIVAPSEHLYLWKDTGEIRLDKVSIKNQIAIENRVFNLIMRAGANSASRLIRSENTVATKPIADLSVPKDHVGLLYIDGKLAEQLPPGNYGFWQLSNKVELKNFDCRTQILEVSGQEILSKDRVSLRINLSASIQIKDAQLAASSVDKLDEYIYKTLQLALREAVGTKSLDDILIDKLYINETVKELVTTQLSSIGIELKSVGVKDIILPGEMKAILNQVVEAQKAAEANVIKRREETSATRSLHNTAKVMENNPTLMRLKELEALEKVADRIDSLTVYGGLDGLMNGVVKLT